MVSYRTVWLAAWIAFGVAWVGSAPAALLRMPEQPRPHEFLGTVKSLFGNVLIITLDQDDRLGGSKKGDAIAVKFSASTHVRTGDRYLPGTQVFVAASPDGTAWTALDVLERRPAPIAEGPSASPRSSAPSAPPPLSPAMLAKMRSMLADAGRPRPPCQSCRIQLQSEDRRDAPTITTSRLGNTFYVAFYEYVDATAYEVVVNYECAVTFSGTSAKLCVTSATVPMGVKGFVYHSTDMTPKGKNPFTMHIKASARLYKKYEAAEGEVTDLITSHEQALTISVAK